MAHYTNLEVWKQSIQLVKEIYNLTKKYPKEEMFALTSQTKQAAVSIPSNIVEGLGRNYKKDTLQFLHIARGSICELQTHLHIALIIGIIQPFDFDIIMPLTDTTLKLLNGFINSFENRSDLH